LEPRIVPLFERRACLRILADIVNVKLNSAEKEHAQKVLEYYCKIKGIDVGDIPIATGAI